LTSVPSFLLFTVVISIAGTTALVRRKGRRVPLTPLLEGVAGIFGCHFFSPFPTDSVGAFCLISGFLVFAAFTFLVETSPISP
jgi:hypothetical protein